MIQLYLPGFGAQEAPAPQPLPAPMLPQAPEAKSPDKSIKQARDDEAKRATLRKGQAGTNKTAGLLKDEDATTTTPTLMSG